MLILLFICLNKIKIISIEDMLKFATLYVVFSDITGYNNLGGV